MRHFLLLNCITLLIASFSFAIVSPIFGQAEVYNLLEGKVYQPADAAGENIGKTFVGGEPPAARTISQHTSPLSTSSSIVSISTADINGTNIGVSSASVSGGSRVAAPAWLITMGEIVSQFFPI
ncbi:hypothetical protein CANMA_003348 [Candida margitis]|uniref:uncharacterized protein n=1 Tax=Candida margitis TaxID=1775924 RepID=UPI0022267B59|nr:uncharacterized protein CANMA_003348 [Candida margitis]KAI5966102.1 hypothetical protein CANMA_003348 [Candida margitis]